MGRKLPALAIKIILLVFCCHQFVIAQSKMQGVVTDLTSGEPLFGANVILLGTSLGAATNFDGEFIINDIAPGQYTFKVSYIGYETKETELTIPDGVTIEENVSLKAVSLSTELVEVTAQAVGQNAAINQQLSSDNIVNVVSSARIQELPDQNAAESIGRLPGVSLYREGGQATKVVIRGLSPQYSMVTMNGVPIPSNETGGSDNSGGGRGIDMRMISSSSLDGIEVFKSNTPDMDAAVLGGTVNLGIRKAHRTMPEDGILPSYMPKINLLVQGGYKDLTNEFNNYKIDLGLEKRFMDDKFGVFVQAIAQQQNLTSNRLDANYGQYAKTVNPDSLYLSELNLYFYPRKEERYSGTFTFDYQIPDGNIALTNILTKSESNTSYFRQRYRYDRGGNNIHYYMNETPQELTLITNILNYEQHTSFGDFEATLSHAYTENIKPDSYTMTFEQLSAGTNQIDDSLPPVELAALAHQKVDQTGLELRNVATSNSFTKQREFRGSFDFTKDITLTDFLSVEIKAGGMYANMERSYDYNAGYGYVWFGEIGERIINAFPWLSDWGVIPGVNESLYLTPFLDPDMNIGTFLNGDYTFDNKLNPDYMRRIKEIVVDYGKNLDAAPTGGAGAWVPNMFHNQYRDYTGNEYRSAGYLMGTFSIGQYIKLMAGARYQNLTTKYSAKRFYNAASSNPYPNELPHLDTTVVKSHGYWLPAVNIKFDPLPWLSLRGAYSNTLAYPDYREITPMINVYSGGLDWNDVNLKPTRSENFDLQLSVYSNEMGLFTFGGFLKRITDHIFYMDGYVNDPTKYEGLHDVPQYPNLNVQGYRLYTNYNNPHTVDLYGIESDWQTHFWYLPGLLSSIVLNVNYTHTFSEAEYPRTIVGNTGYPLFKPTYTDTSYQDKLIDQPDDIINVSLGWDFEGFSILVSMIYQSSIFQSTNYWDALRVDKGEYLRFDVAARQKLPWYNMEVFVNLNNLNGENDTRFFRGNNYRDTDESYGFTAEIGLRTSFR